MKITVRYSHSGVVAIDKTSKLYNSTPNECENFYGLPEVIIVNDAW